MEKIKEFLEQNGCTIYSFGERFLYAEKNLKKGKIIGFECMNRLGCDPPMDCKITYKNRSDTIRINAYLRNIPKVIDFFSEYFKYYGG